MSELAEKEKTAIERLKAFEPEDEPYHQLMNLKKRIEAIRASEAQGGKDD